MITPIKILFEPVYRFPLNLENNLQIRKQESSLRKLGIYNELIDFSSNDYLGLSSSRSIFERAGKLLHEHDFLKNGASGSRLLSGNHKFYELTENYLAKFHDIEATLIFNSGYDANLGFFSSVPGRGDIIFYDELAHASIRDGISMSHAHAYKFRHNDVEDLKNKVQKLKPKASKEIYIVTESVFSMDGDSPDLKELAKFSSENNFFLIVDEAHAVGVYGEKGAGLVQELKLQKEVFARIITFGKALGSHGAAVLASEKLKEYLVNFARSLIYTTALPPHSVATVLAAYHAMEPFSDPAMGVTELLNLKNNIHFFKSELLKNKLQPFFINSHSAIHSCIVPGNEKIKTIAKELETAGFDVKPILSPTVPKGKERLRFCLHSFNSQQEIAGMLKVLAKFVS